MGSIGNEDSGRFCAVAASLMTAQKSAAQAWDVDLPGEQNKVLDDAELGAKLSSLVCCFLFSQYLVMLSYLNKSDHEPSPLGWLPG